MRKSDSEWIDLKCPPRGVYYDYHKRVGVLLMEPLHNCDMTACIRRFQAISANVAIIYTIAGEKPDAVYERVARGGWIAHHPWFDLAKLEEWLGRKLV